MLLFSPSTISFAQRLLLIILLQSTTLSGEQSEQYLKDVMSSLSEKQQISQNEEFVQVQKLPVKTRRDEDEHPQLQYHPSNQNNNEVPELSLSKTELAAIYQHALTSGKTVNLKTPTNEQPIKAVVHELDVAETSNNYPTKTAYNSDANDDSYYYYYYPIKSFLDHLTPNSEEPPHEEHYEVTKPSLTQYHAHTHQHNVRIMEVKDGSTLDKKKMMHPLFMALSGFLGMAAMFILSAFILPKFGIKKSAKQRNAVKEFALGTDVILKAIEGDDCSERIRCEIGKVVQRTNIHDNRFIKLLRRIAPSFIRTQMDKIKKYVGNKKDCSVIKCRKSTSKPKAKKKSTKMLL